MKLIIYLSLLCAVFQQCRCNDFEDTDARTRQYVEITISVDEDSDKSINIINEEKKLNVVDHSSKKPWKKVVRFALTKIKNEDDVENLGKEQSEKFSFTDNKGKNYDVEVFYKTSFKLISPSRMGIVQYKIDKIVCGDYSVKLTNKDWLSSSYYESDATIYI